MTDTKKEHAADNSIKTVARKPVPLLNLEYKDSVFRFLISSDKQHALSLVNAITGRNYPPETEVEYNTIGAMIYMGIRNDVSFIIHDIMYLFEHQSSLNPNMSLREFLYFARKVNTIVERNQNLYRNVRIMIPTPQCFVFCNAKDMKTDSEELHLSDSYRDKSIYTGCEWTVHVLNINRGHNKELMDACSILREYSEFVAISREWQKKEAGVTGMDHAIDECIEKGILVKFLREHRLEVRDMSLDEFNVEEYTELIREDSFNEGKAEGDLERAIKTAKKMITRGDSLDYIADTLEVNIDQIKEWISIISEAGTPLSN
ncbi:MAG: hypothetical protein LUE29_07240 [Lachnospiraceae bacterium]|nr:hypothetical protein [Lachnospiraceae bacterium]